MGHPINYLIKMPGADFNRLVRNPCPIVGKSFDEMLEKGTWIWESRLPCSDLGIDYNAVGQWTLCSIPVHYSLLLNTDSPVAQSELQKVYAFEKCLLSLVGTAIVYRIDYIIIQEWDSKYDFRWINDSKLVQEFLNWLLTEDPRHWSLLLRRMTSRELFDLNRNTSVDHTLIDALRQYPVAHILEHCGKQFEVSPFDIYAVCPTCKTEFKVRSFAAVTEIENVFDAVFEWLLTPEAQAACRRRQEEIKADLEGEDPPTFTTTEQ